MAEHATAPVDELAPVVELVASAPPVPVEEGTVVQPPSAVVAAASQAKNRDIVGHYLRRGANERAFFVDASEQIDTLLMRGLPGTHGRGSATS